MPDGGSGHSRAVAGPCVLHGHRRKRLGGKEVLKDCTKGTTSR